MLLERVDCPSAPSPSNRLDNEARHQTTSGVRFNDAQTVTAADLDCTVVDRTSNVAAELGRTREEVECKTGETSQTTDCTSGDSVAARSPRSDRERGTAAVEGDPAAVRPLNVASGAERSRRSCVKLSRRRHHVGTSTDAVRRRSAVNHDASNSSSAEKTRCAVVSPTLHNGIKPDDER